MAEIKAADVKALRDQTGAGMMDAKKALIETNGNIEEAVDWLRTKGLAKAAKKSSRTAAEGLVAIALGGCGGVVVEVNAETDFVARNDQFQGFARQVADVALARASTVEELAAAEFGNGKSVQDELTDKIATIGENMMLRRMQKLSVTDGVVAGYMHNQIADNLGKIGVLVALESTGDKEKLADLGKKIAMHVAAAFPQALSPAEVDQSAAERERNVLREQALASGKPADIVEKMLEGRMRKWYEEVCLTEQVFVMDGETKITKLVEDASKEIGAPVKLTGYARLQLGEGIEKEQCDFAAEVAAAVNG
ncbi:MAG: elongation factor Ts [Alphaproteobacteria bacterium]|nr:elongation factor Ts [Alphaproteobacteria bacterium]